MCVCGGVFVCFFFLLIGGVGFFCLFAFFWKMRFVRSCLKNVLKKQQLYLLDT